MTAGWVSSILGNLPSISQLLWLPLISVNPISPHLARSVVLSPKVTTSPEISFSGEQKRVWKKSLLAASTILWAAILTPNTSMTTSLNCSFLRKSIREDVEICSLFRTCCPVSVLTPVCTFNYIFSNIWHINTKQGHVPWRQWTWWRRIETSQKLYLWNQVKLFRHSIYKSTAFKMISFNNHS